MGSMTPADQKERDKRHVRSLQVPRLIHEFRLCNVAIADMERAELLGAISWLIQHQETFKHPKRNPHNASRETDGQHERHTNVS